MAYSIQEIQDTTKYYAMRADKGIIEITKDLIAYCKERNFVVYSADFYGNCRIYY